MEDSLGSLLVALFYEVPETSEVGTWPEGSVPGGCLQALHLVLSPLLLLSVPPGCHAVSPECMGPKNHGLSLCKCKARSIFPPNVAFWESLITAMQK